MAIIKNGLIGTSRKSIGSIVTYNLNGQNVARTKASSFKDANSADQKLQRGAFSEIVQLGRRLLPVIRSSYSNRPAKRSGFANFISVNLLNGAYDKVSKTFDYSKLNISSGTLRKLDIQEVTFDAMASKLNLFIRDNSDGVTAFPTDSVKVVVIDVLDDKIHILNSINKRADTFHQFTLYPRDTTTNRFLHVYAFASDGEPECPNCNMSEEEWNEVEALFA